MADIDNDIYDYLMLFLKLRISKQEFTAYFALFFLVKSALSIACSDFLQLILHCQLLIYDQLPFL